MKKILLLITLLITGVALKSQEIDQSRIRLGFNCYPGISTIYGETLRDKAGFKLSYGIGMTVEIAVNNNWIVSSGIQYIRKGYKLEDNSDYKYDDYDSWNDTIIVWTSTEYNENSKINSFSVPITLKYYTGNKIRYYGLLGIYASYLIYNFEIGEYGYIIPHTQPIEYFKPRNVKSAIKSDFGINIGTGICVPINTKTSFEIGPIACLGLKDVFSPVSNLFYDKITDLDQKNLVLHLKVAVLLNF